MKVRKTSKLERQRNMNWMLYQGRVCLQPVLIERARNLARALQSERPIRTGSH